MCREKIGGVCCYRTVCEVGQRGVGEGRGGVVAKHF